MIHPSLTNLARRELGERCLVDLREWPQCEILRLTFHANGQMVDGYRRLTRADMLAHDGCIGELRRQVVVEMCQQAKREAVA